jgi:hypothetical protein
MNDPHIGILHDDITTCRKIRLQNRIPVPFVAVMIGILYNELNYLSLLVPDCEQALYLPFS